MENLFGHLCSGTEFGHDREMEDRLARQNATLNRQRVAEDMNPTMSYRETSVEAIGCQRTGSDPANRYRSDTDDHPYNDALDCTRGAGKRQRLSPPFDEDDQEVRSSQTRPSSEELFPSTTQGVTRYSFDAYRRKSSKLTAPARVATLLSPGAMSVRFGTGFEHLVTSNTLEPSPGTQAKPFELSDSLSSRTDDDDDNDKAEGFLLDQLPIQRDFRDSDNLIQSGRETQLSLSTSAFESQGSDRPYVGTNMEKIQHRKEAYKAARELSGDWEVEHSLVSSRTDHDEEEIEL